MRNDGRNGRDEYDRGGVGRSEKTGRVVGMTIVTRCFEVVEVLGVMIAVDESGGQFSSTTDPALWERISELVLLVAVDPKIDWVQISSTFAAIWQRLRGDRPCRHTDAVQ